MAIMGTRGLARGAEPPPTTVALITTEVRDPSFDRFARLVRLTLGCAVSLVSIVERDRQVFIGAEGLDEELDQRRETPLSHSFCQHVVAEQEPLVVHDARVDPRVLADAAVAELDVVAYAGWPLRDHHDRIIGSLCAIERGPRTWTAHELALLEDLAAACSAEIAQRALRSVAVAGEREARALSERSEVLLTLSERLAVTQTTSDVARAVTGIARSLLGCLRAGIWLRPVDPDLPGQVQPPTPEAPPEDLTWVDPGDEPWPSARHFSVLPLTSDNPLGRTLLGGAPTFLTSRADQDRVYPLLRNPDQLGQARAYVPLRMNRRAYGVLVLVWEQPGEIGPDERATIAALGSYAAQAVARAVLVQERLDALVTLQSSMMSRLPEVPGVELAARYLPAATRDQVGGDWYDVVSTSRDLCLVVGDVVGHDIEAAATMGQLRNMLRTLLWEDQGSPAATASRLDRAMRDLDVDALATVLQARLRPEADGSGWELRWTTAGHPTPLVVTPDGRASFLLGRADVMLGVRPDAPRRDHVEHLPPGTTLLLCTDGLVERRGEDIGVGLERLREAAERHHALGLDALLDAVRRDLVGRRQSDDVALLAARLAEGGGR